MTNILPLLPALIHIYIFILESLLWGKKRTNKIFGLRPEDIESTRLLAFNQGFYNLFLAVAIFFGLALRQSEATTSAGTALILYGLGCMVVAGVILILAQRRLWRGALLQILPAILAMIPFFIA